MLIAQETKMKNNTQSILKRFMRDSKGSVAMLFGLSLLPMMAGVGAAIDYGRASNSRQAIQAAADAAALAGAKARSVSDDEASKVAKQVFDANLKMSGISVNVTPTVQLFDTGGMRISGTTQLPNTFLPVMGMKTSDVSFHAEANMAAASTPGVNVVGDEIALVLDNTGSMSKDMVTLREATVAFAEKAMTGKTKISVVPFVTAVNVGPSNLAMSQMDTRADSQWHGAFVRLITDPKRGSEWWSYAVALVEGGCKSEGGGVPSSDPGKGGKGAFLKLDDQSNEELLHSIFGIGRAHAQSGQVTANTIPPLQGVTKMSGPGSAKPTQVFVPTGFREQGGGFCTMGAPDKVSHFDLLSRMPNAKWKGCVEARPEPFDVTDDPPVAGKADTLYVPYFWPDESDAGSPGAAHIKEGVNNYMNDGTVPKGWLLLSESGPRTANLLKYDGKNLPKIVETAPDTSGPNKACPTELLRLTDDKTKVKTTLQNMQHWNGGGTILVEGLAWGWRTLSPQLPFADGKAYTKDAKKTIVFMSDGDNEIGDAPGTDNYSHYTGYGYLGNGRFPMAKFEDANKYLDERFLLACKNAKDKGIKIITVLFRNKQGNSVKMMEQCASTPADAYFAGDQIALKKTFDTISGGFSTTTLKLTK
jgi:Flp pilus assembly protein TadG